MIKKEACIDISWSCVFMKLTYVYIKYIKIANATQETKALQEHIRAYLNTMPYATDEEAFFTTYQKFKIQFKQFTVFLAYFDKQWLNVLHYGAKLGD